MTRERGSGITPQRVVDLLTKEVSEKSMLAVSKATGIGLAAIGRYLKGVGEPTTKTLQKLAGYFNVSVGWLRGDIPWTHEMELETQEFARDIAPLIDGAMPGALKSDPQFSNFDLKVGLTNCIINAVTGISDGDDSDKMFDGAFRYPKLMLAFLQIPKDQWESAIAFLHLLKDSGYDFQNIIEK